MVPCENFDVEEDRDPVSQTRPRYPTLRLVSRGELGRPVVYGDLTEGLDKEKGDFVKGGADYRISKLRADNREALKLFYDDSLTRLFLLDLLPKGHRLNEILGHDDFVFIENLVNDANVSMTEILNDPLLSRHFKVSIAFEFDERIRAAYNI